MKTLLIQHGQIVTEDGTHQSDILIENGIITKLAAHSSQLTADQTIDAKNHLIFPGLIDCHVHFRDPGMSEAEDMESGGAAALAGGITTVCDMPNTDPPTCTRKALEEKLAIRDTRYAIRKVDIRFFFGVTNAEHLKELEKVEREKIVGVKLYFDHSTGNQKAEHAVIEEAMTLCAARDIPVVCHAEDPLINEQAKQANASQAVSAHSTNRPPESEATAIEKVITIAKKTGAPLHIAHLSTSTGLDLVAQAKADKLNVTCEVAPHHLFLTIDDYKALGTLGKMNPPLRARSHTEALWQGITDKVIDCVASDHAPHTLESKTAGTPLEAPSGVPGVETTLPLLLSVAAGHSPHPSYSHTLILSYSDISRLLFTRPNQIFSLDKPGITVGKPVDICIVNPTESWAIRGKELKSKCGWTPYEGWKAVGRVTQVVT